MQRYGVAAPRKQTGNYEPDKKEGHDETVHILTNTLKKLEVSTSVQHYNIIENRRRTKTPQGVCRTEYVNRLGHIIFL